MFSKRRASRSSTSNEVSGQRAHRPDYQIVLYIGLLMLIGLVIMYAIGPQRANVMNNLHGTDFYTDTYFAVKQVASLFLAILAFFVLSKIPLEWLKKHAHHILLIGVGLSVLLFVAGNLLKIDAIATETLGAYRWFKIGSLSFQPAEFLKFGLLVYLAVFLGVRLKQGLINSVEKTIIPVVVVTLVSLFLIVVIQKDLGTGVALGSIVSSMLMVSGLNKKISIILVIGVLVLGFLSIVSADHRRERLVTFLSGDNHSVDGENNSYHIKNAMIALGTGGLFGRGIGNSIQATGYLPEAINDSIFAIIGETFGFIGVCIILGIFTLLLFRLLRIVERMPDPTMRLIIAGVFGWLAAHVILNVASMIGLVPLTGITLPLLSFGGTSMLFITGALGLAFNISKYTKHEIVNEEAANENLSGRRRIGRTRVSGRRRS